MRVALKSFKSTSIMENVWDKNWMFHCICRFLLMDGFDTMESIDAVDLMLIDSLTIVSSNRDSQGGYALIKYCILHIMCRAMNRKLLFQAGYSLWLKLLSKIFVKRNFVICYLSWSNRTRCNRDQFITMCCSCVVAVFQDKGPFRTLRQLCQNASNSVLIENNTVARKWVATPF